MATVILINQTTNGGEYILDANGSDFVGVFHVYDDGTLRTGTGVLGSTTQIGFLLIPNPVAQGLPQYTNPSTAPIAFSGPANSVNVPTTPDGQSLIFEEDKLSKDGYKKHATAVYQSRYDNEVYTNVVDTTISELLNIRPTPPMEILNQPADLLNESQLRVIGGSNLQLNVRIDGPSVLNPPISFSWYQDGEPIVPIGTSNNLGSSVYRITTSSGGEEIEIPEVPGGTTGTALQNALFDVMTNDLGYTPQAATNYIKNARKVYTQNKLTIYNLKTPESGFWNCQITDSEGNVVISEGVFVDVIDQYDLTVFNGNIIKNGDARQGSAFWTKVGDATPVSLAMQDESGPYYFGSQFKGDNSMALDGRYYPPSDFWDGVNPGTKGQPVTRDQRYFFGGWQPNSTTADNYVTYPLNSYSTMRQEIDLTEAIEIIDKEIVGVEDVKMDVWSWLGSMGWTESLDGRINHHDVVDGKVRELWGYGWGKGSLNSSPISSEKYKPYPNGSSEVDMYDTYVRNWDGLGRYFLNTGQVVWWQVGLNSSGGGNANVSKTVEPISFVWWDYRHGLFTDWVRSQVQDKVYVTYEFYGGEEEKLNTGAPGTSFGQHVLENPYYYEELPHSLYFYVVNKGNSLRGNNGGNLESGGWFRANGTVRSGDSWVTGPTKFISGAYLDKKAGLIPGGVEHPDSKYFYWDYYDNGRSSDAGTTRGSQGGYRGTIDTDFDGNYSSGTGAGARNDNQGSRGYKTSNGYQPFDFVYPAGGGDSNSNRPLHSISYGYSQLAFNGIRYNRIHKKTKFYYTEKNDIKVPKGTRKLVVTVRYERDSTRGYEYSRLGYNKNPNPAPSGNGTYGLMNNCAATNINAHLKVILK